MVKESFLIKIVLVILGLFCSCSNQVQTEESLVYLQKTDNSFHIYQSDLVGAWQRKLTGKGVLEKSPYWNKDSGQLIYYAMVDKKPALFAMSMSNRKEVVLSLPDSFTLFPSSDTQSWLYLKEELNRNVIYNCPRNDFNHCTILDHSKFAYYSPSLNNDRDLLAFMSDRNGTIQLYMKDLKSSQTRQLTAPPMIAKYFCFSPEGDKIAVSLSKSNDSGGDIHILDLKTGQFEQLTKSPYLERELAWSPSGEKVAFKASTQADGDQIYTIDIGTLKFTKITSGDFYHSLPTWISKAY